MARSAYREAVGYFEQALSALPHLPEQRDTREQAIDLRLALRSALLRLATLGVSWRLCARPKPSPRPSTTRVGWHRSRTFCQSISRHGRHDQAIAAAQRALALATAGGEVVLQALANHYLGIAYQPKASIVGRSTASGRPWRPSTGLGATSASVRSSCPPCTPVPFSPVPCRTGHVRRGQCPRGRRAADC